MHGANRDTTTQGRSKAVLTRRSGRGGRQLTQEKGDGGGGLMSPPLFFDTVVGE